MSRAGEAVRLGVPGAGPGRSFGDGGGSSGPPCVPGTPCAARRGFAGKGPVDGGRERGRENGESGVPTPFHAQRIAHGGPCGKAPVVTQNHRPKPGTTDIGGSRNASAVVDVRVVRGRRTTGRPRARGAVAGGGRAGADGHAAGRDRHGSACRRPTTGRPEPATTVTVTGGDDRGHSRGHDRGRDRGHGHGRDGGHEHGHGHRHGVTPGRNTDRRDHDDQRTGHPDPPQAAPDPPRTGPVTGPDPLPRTTVVRDHRTEPMK